MHSDWIKSILRIQNVKYCYSLRDILIKFNNNFYMNLKLKKFIELLKLNMKISYKYPASIKSASLSENIN